MQEGLALILLFPPPKLGTNHMILMGQENEYLRDITLALSSSTWDWVMNLI